MIKALFFVALGLVLGFYLVAQGCASVTLTTGRYSPGAGGVRAARTPKANPKTAGDPTGRQGKPAGSADPAAVFGSRR